MRSNDVKKLLWTIRRGTFYSSQLIHWQRFATTLDPRVSLAKSSLGDGFPVYTSNWNIWPLTSNRVTSKPNFVATFHWYFCFWILSSIHRSIGSLNVCALFEIFGSKFRQVVELCEAYHTHLDHMKSCLIVIDVKASRSFVYVLQVMTFLIIPVSKYRSVGQYNASVQLRP